MPNCISIPHGTIKRIDPGASGGVAIISIPHGTIKSHHRLASVLGLQHFNSTWYD